MNSLRVKIALILIGSIAAVMLVISFAMLLVINLIQAWARRRYGDV